MSFSDARIRWTDDAVTRLARRAAECQALAPRCRWEISTVDARWISAGTIIERDGDRATSERFDLGTLASHRVYFARGIDFGPSTWFTTSSVTDAAAPARPIVRTLAITVSGSGMHSVPIPALLFDADIDADAAMLRFTFTSNGRSLSVTAVPGNLRKLERPARMDWCRRGPPMCDAALPLVPGDHVLVSVTAIDLAGNESAAVSRTVEVEEAEPASPRLDH